MASHLNRFAHQLADWTTTIIEQGQTPVRLVDTAPIITTRAGQFNPPLVFWINRQSLMAAGILLLPEDDLAEQLEWGIRCAEALGLRYFATWEKDQLRIWRQTDELNVHQTIPCPASDDIGQFQYRLKQLLDSFKLLIVPDTVPALELHPCFFVNLFEITLARTHPLLAKYFRARRAANQHHTTMPSDPEHRAQETNRLILLQVLALFWHRQLPTKILPEKFEQALTLSLPALPPELYRLLNDQDKTGESVLPQEAAVAFHHLLLRLHQLSWSEPSGRAWQSLLLLQQGWFPGNTIDPPTEVDRIYPQTPPQNAFRGTLVAGSAALLASCALSRAMSGQRGGKLLRGPLFKIDSDDLTSLTGQARLLEQRPLMDRERSLDEARLRTAWPNRRLKPRRGDPFWLWEFIHLLGIGRHYQSLEITLPDNWLQVPAASPLWSLLRKYFILQKISFQEDTSTLSLIPGKPPENCSVTVTAKGWERHMPLPEQPPHLRSLLILTAILPDVLYQYLNKTLTLEAEAPSGHPEGLERYRRTEFYQQIFSLLQPDRNRAEGAEAGYMLYPSPALLAQLESEQKPANKQGDNSSIENCLAWILAGPFSPVLTLSPQTPRLGRSQVAGGSRKEQRTVILKQLEEHGIPQFPEQYLYFVKTAQITHFSMVPPLQQKERLLGSFELEDAAGRIIAGLGEELENALLIAAACGRTEIDLPKDRNQLGIILDQYRKDLRQLYDYLGKLCYSQFIDGRAAEKARKSIWGALDLPPRIWFKK